MKEGLGDLLLLKHVKKCIDDLMYIMNGVDADTFYRVTEKKYAVERVLEIIGEAINHISPETLGKADKVISWRDIVDFRNLVSHEYFRVDYTMVYKIATEGVLDLRITIENLIEQLEN
jgi:uncharacterized protein with HEPN domain